MNKYTNCLKGIMAGGLLTLSPAVNHVQVIVHELVGSNLAGGCSYSTKIAYPEGYEREKIELLRKFETCSEPLSLTVLTTGDIEVSTHDRKSIGRLKENGSIAIIFSK